MNRELVIEYEVFEDEKITVLSVVDKEKDEVLNMFKGKTAEWVFKYLTTVKEDASAKDEVVVNEMKKIHDEIMSKLEFVLHSDNLTQESIKHIFAEIRKLVDYFEELALEGKSAIRTTM